ncbi:MAG: hypothetical protein ACK5GN_05590 [Pseudomonadota bacterium]
MIVIQGELALCRLRQHIVFSDMSSYGYQMGITTVVKSTLGKIHRSFSPRCSLQAGGPKLPSTILVFARFFDVAIHSNPLALKLLVRPARSVLALCVLSSFVCLGCGGEGAPSFGGVWEGSYDRLTNTCPFTVVEDINPLFPMTVSVDANDVFTVVAVNGERAVGGQGQGESISFLAKSDKFGNYGSIAPYACESIVSEVGFLSAGTDKADATLTIKFNNCASPGADSKKVTCGATYFGDAVRVSQ